jgi:hypothetical protein
MIYKRKDRSWVLCDLVGDSGPETGDVATGKAWEKIMEETQVHHTISHFSSAIHSFTLNLEAAGSSRMLLPVN